jgi:hypothetical protein
MSAQDLFNAIFNASLARAQDEPIHRTAAAPRPA